jgi:PAS domain S-box-containing protein
MSRRSIATQKQAQRLTLAGFFLSLLLTASACCMLDAGGRVTTWNRGAQRMAGYCADEILGCHFARFYHPQDVAQGKPRTDRETASSNGHAHGQGWRVRKDGTRFWADVVIAALRDRTATCTDTRHWRAT